MGNTQHSYNNSNSPVNKQQLEEELFNAIERDKLLLEYQPVVDINTEKITGADARIVWKHPDYGKVFPVELLKESDNLPLKKKLTEFCIDEIFKQAFHWRKEGIPFSEISVTMHPDIFFHDSLVQVIAASLRKHKVPPRLIEIRLPSTVIKSVPEKLLDTLLLLKRLNFKLGIYLSDTRDLSFTFPKDIFTKMILADPCLFENTSIDIHSFIHSAKQMGMIVAGKTIQTDEQWEKAKKLGCDELQGSLFSPCVSAVQMRNWFIQNDNPRIFRKGEVEERRKYFRMDFPYPLIAQMKIESINGMKGPAGSGEVLIQNIGLGGLRFITLLDLSKHKNIVCRIETELMSESFSFTGKIVWRREKRIGIFVYGIEFLINDAERDRLAGILFNLAVKMRKGSIMNEGRFISENAEMYLRDKAENS